MGGARKINAIVVGICMEIYSKNGTRSAVMKIMVPIQMKTKKTMLKLRFIFYEKKTPLHLRLPPMSASFRCN